MLPLSLKWCPTLFTNCLICTVACTSTWVLMPNKKLESYDRVWAAIKLIGLIGKKQKSNSVVETCFGLVCGLSKVH